MTRIMRMAKRLLMVAVVLFIAAYLVRNAGQIARYEYSIEWEYVLCALAFATLAYLLNISTWARIANTCGAEATWRRHAIVWSTSRLARYIPGKIATLYLRIDGYSEARAQAGVSLYIEVTSSLIAVCGFILTSWLAGTASLNRFHVLLVALALTGLGALSSRHTLRKLTGMSPTFRSILPPEVFPGYRWWAITVLLQVMIILLHGMSLYFAVLSVADLRFGALIELTVYYYFAGLAGMVALFAPAGIGVREAVLVGFIQTMMPLPAAIASVALARVVTVVAECAISATFHIVERPASRLTTIRQGRDLLRDQADQEDDHRRAK